MLGKNSGSFCVRAWDGRFDDFQPGLSEKDVCTKLAASTPGTCGTGSPDASHGLNTTVESEIEDYVRIDLK